MFYIPDFTQTLRFNLSFSAKTRDVIARQIALLRSRYCRDILNSVKKYFICRHARISIILLDILDNVWIWSAHIVDKWVNKNPERSRTKCHGIPVANMADRVRKSLCQSGATTG